MQSRGTAIGGASVGRAPAPADLVGLTALAVRTSGSVDVPIGLIDGPVDIHHPDLAESTLRPAGAEGLTGCSATDGDACLHGTFMAGILAARRSSPAPGLCPASPLLIRRIYTTPTGPAAATPAQLAEAIGDCIGAGARIINLSAELTGAGEHVQLSRALDDAARRGVIVVAAAGNRSELTAGTLAGHPWVVPAAACDRRGVALTDTNLGASIGRRGVLAPGEDIVSLAPAGRTATLTGTSAAAAFVTGALALAWSLAPQASSSAVRWALARAHRGRRSVVPPLLDASALAEALTGTPRSADA
jgi:subtilisin family serine protease